MNNTVSIVGYLMLYGLPILLVLFFFSFVWTVARAVVLKLFPRREDDFRQARHARPDAVTQAHPTDIWIGQNRIIAHNGEGTAFLVRAVRAQDICGGSDGHFPYSVKCLRRGLYMVYSLPTAPGEADVTIKTKKNYRFVPYVPSYPLSELVEENHQYVEEVK